MATTREYQMRGVGAATCGSQGQAMVIRVQTLNAEVVHVNRQSGRAKTSGLTAS